MLDAGKIIEENEAYRASFNLNLSEHLGEQPDLVIANWKRAREQNVPYTIIRDSDNTQIFPTHDARKYALLFQKYLANNPQKVGMFKDDLDALDKFVRFANPDAKEPIHGPTWNNWVKMQIDNYRKDEDFDVDGILKDKDVPENIKRQILGAITRDEELHLAIINTIQSDRTDDWQKWSDEKLRRMLREYNTKMNWGVDVDSLDLSKLRKAGVTELRWGDFLKGFSAYDIHRFGEALVGAPEQIMAIDERNPIEQQLMKLALIQDMQLEARGRDFWGGVMAGLQQFPGYAIELGITAGLAMTTGGAGAAPVATAQTARLAGKAALKATVKKITKKLLGKVGKVAVGEAKRMVAFVPADLAGAIADIERQPIYFMDENGMNVKLSEDRTDELGTVFANRLLSRYMGNFSERMGGVLIPNINMTKYLPKVLKKSLAARFIADMADDPVKQTMFGRYLRENLPFSGVFTELGEERIERYLNFLSTDFAKLTGIEAFDMGVDDPFGTWEEFATELAVTSVIGNTRTAINTPANIKRMRNVANWVDQHRGMVERLQNTKINSKDVYETTEFVNSVREDNKVLVDLEAIEELSQTAPEFLQALGVTQEAIAKAQELGQCVQISENALIVAQSQSPENYQAGEQLLQSARPFGDLSVKEASSIDLSVEAQERFKEQQEFKAALQLKIGELKAIGVSESNIRKIMPILNRFAAMIDRATPDTVLGFLDRIKFLSPEEFDKFTKENPEKYIGNLKQAKANAGHRAELKSTLQNMGVPQNHIVYSLLNGVGEISNDRNVINFEKGGTSTTLGKHLIELKQATRGGVTLQELVDNFEATFRGKREFKKKSKEGFYTYTNPETGIKYTLRTYEKNGKEFLKSFYSNRSEKATKKMIENLHTSIGRNADVVHSHSQSEYDNISPDSEKVKSQNQENDERIVKGKYRPPNSENFLSSPHLITVMTEGDITTVTHEIFHYVFETVKYFVDNNLATPELVEEYNKLVEWANKQSDLFEGDNFREKIARAFEAYIFEGKAPTTALIGIFSAMARMFRQVYREIKTLGVQINDEVRNVFDNWLTSAEEVENESVILSVAREMDIALLGMNEADRKEFMKLIAAAKEQSTAELSKEKEKQLKEQRKLWKAEVEDLIKNDRTLSTFRLIEKENKLDYAFVLKLMGEEVAKVLKEKGLTKNKNGRSPAEVALETNHSDVATMLRNLAKSESPQEFTRRYLNEAEQAFNKQFEMSAEAMVTDLNIKSWDKLSEALALKAGQQGWLIKQKMLKSKALAEVDVMTVREVLNDKIELAAVKKATSEMVKAFNNKDFITAMEKWEHIRHNMEIIRAKKGSVAIVDHVRKTIKKGRNVAKGKILGESKEALQDISERFGFSQKLQQPPEANVQSVLDSINSDRETPIEIPDFIIRDTRPYTDLTFEEFVDLFNVVDMVYNYGRDYVSESKEAVKNRIKANKEGILQGMEDLPKKFKRSNGVISQVKHGWNWLVSSNMNLRRMLKRLGKYDENSEAVKILDELMVAASQQYNLMEPVYAILKKEYEFLDESLNGTDFSNLPVFPEDVVSDGAEWNKSALLSVLLNMGTAKNRKALLDGFMWSEEDLDNIASRLSTEQWKAIQRIWDTIGNSSLTTMWADAYRKEYYSAPIIEKPQPFIANATDGQFYIRGGYMPLHYMFLRHGDLKDSNKGVDTLRNANRQMSFNHERSNRGAGSPVLLNPDLVFHHIYDVTHYITHGEIMRRLTRVFSDHKVATDIRTKFGFEFYDSLATVLKNIADPSKVLFSKAEGLDAWLKRSRGIMVNSALWGNPQSIAKQFTSLTVGAADLGHYWFDAWADTVTDFSNTWELINNKSGFMRDRFNSKDSDLQDVFHNLDKNKVQKILGRVQKAGFIPMQLADHVVALPLWLGMYRKCIEEGMSESKAIAKADAHVAGTQGGNRPMDWTEFMTGERSKHFAVFMGPVSALHNYNLETIDMWRLGAIDAPTGIIRLTTSLVLPTLAPAFVVWAMKGGLGDDDDDQAEKAFIRELITSPFSGFGLVRDIVDATTNFMLGQRGGQTVLLEDTYLRGFNDIGNAVWRGGKAIGSGDLDIALYESARIVSNALRVPVLDVYKRLKRVAESYEE